MHEIAKHEFFTWIGTLERDTLTEYDTTLLSILINNFEDVASIGTSGGQRAKFLGKKISELKNKIIKELPPYEINDVSENDIERIESLDVEKFRGFSSAQNFKFDKQYTFFHGPNGSGKTSFCEALEYCLLGTIEEASVCNIPLDKYIVHAGEKKARKPVLNCKYKSGEIKECQPSYSKYRFGFVEKNRIDSFSHISAATVKTQTERIASLFGLSEFQEFSRGFTSTDTFNSEKYIKINSPAQKEYETATEKLLSLDTQLKNVDTAREQVKNELEVIIKALHDVAINTMDDVEEYYMNSQDGLIARYTRELDENKWILLLDDELEKLTSNIRILIDCYNEIQKNISDILSDVSAMNYLDLFTSITKINEKDCTQCPVCLTPLDNVTINPFIHAKEELDKLEKIEIAKRVVKDSATKIIDNYNCIVKSIIKIQPVGLLSGIDCELFEDYSIQLEEIQALKPSVIRVFDELKKILQLLEIKDKYKITSDYNRKAQFHNNQFEDRLRKAQKDYKAIVEKNISVEEKKNSYNELNKQFNTEKEKLKNLKEKADAETTIVEFNKRMIEAYDKVTKLLSSYVAELPSKMAHQLSQKVKEYYNFINKDDADFEMITELKLPVATNEKIIIAMEDGISQDALIILSEGHIKILGLSILLAKAIYERSPFLIFDDIVNSIDDDHRDGVARLLITHNDFTNIQMILTCHGELFVSKLESYVTNHNSMVRYMFLPADTLEERGIFIKYQDASIPLKTARDKFENGQLKDSAAKCRQAVECITGKLWRSVIKFNSNGIPISLRSLKGTPDLKSVADALCAAIKPSKLQGAEDLHESLKQLTNNSMWSLLNKGTHIDDTISEFNRSEIKELLELVEKVSKEVDELKIKPINKP